MATREFHKLGERLRKLRSRIRNSDGTPVSQSQLARRCGWKPDKQWKYEDGRNQPSAGRMATLARELGTTVEQLVADESLIDLLPMPEEERPDAAGNA